MSVSDEGAAGFWLPSEFLTDDDILFDNDNYSKTDSQSEFPYDFTHNFPEKLVMSASPQSTLAYLGRSAGGSTNATPTGVTSPLAAQYDAVGNLIHRAAGQVARLRLTQRGDVLGPGPTLCEGLSSPLRCRAQFYPENKVPNLSVFPHAHEKVGGRTRVGMTGQAAWEMEGSPTRWEKSPARGTGVFLPRRYGNLDDSNAYSSESHRKTAAGSDSSFFSSHARVQPRSSTALIPGRAAVHAHTNNFDSISGFAQSQPRFNRTDYTDSLMVPRDAIVLQQHRNLLTALGEGSMASRDLYLPHEWTYY